MLNYRAPATRETLPAGLQSQKPVSLHGFCLDTEFEAFIGYHYIMGQHFLRACGNDVRRNVDGAVFPALNSSRDAGYIAATKLSNYDIQFKVLASLGTRTYNNVGWVSLQVFGS